MIACPVCRVEHTDVAHLADHFWDLAESSDVGHVMWLNRYVGLREVSRDVLRQKLTRALQR